MVSKKNVLCIMVVVAAMAGMPIQGFADRLYTWTDDKGVSHITKTPPPSGAKNKDVVEYSHRTHEEQKATAIGRKKESDLQQEADKALSGSSGSIEQYREEIREDMRQEAAEGKQTCYFQAPGRRVYIRVYSTNSYNEREKEIWNGWIEPNKQAMVISSTNTVLYNRRYEENALLSGDDLATCPGGGVVRIPGS